MQYRQITDWSVEGRRALVATHESEIRCLLEATFMAYLNQPGASLKEYRFHDDDPTMEAADWALGRFRDGEIDPGRLHPGDRSFRLFTRAPFWLAQREGGAGFRRIEAARAAGAGTVIDDVQAGVDAGAEYTDTQRAVGRAAMRLAERTCPTLLTYWLRGTVKMRASWFNWSDADEAVLHELSAKDHSLFTSDALFRFSAIFCALVSAGGPVAARACVETWFSPCPDVKPFRVAEEVVAARLQLGSPREAQRERLAGIVELIRRVLDAAEATVGRQDPEGAVLRACLRKGLLNAYGIEDVTLSGRLAALPREI